MALDAVVFPQDLFGFYKDLCSLGGGGGVLGGGWSLNNLFSLEEEEIKGGGGVVFCEENLEQGLHCNYNHTSSSSLVLLQNVKEQQQEQQEINNNNNYNYNNNNSSPEICNGDGFLAGGLAPPVVEAATTTTTTGRRKRRRTKSCKNKEEVENQRMTHIAVERNRRRQMNEYLAALRSLMPPSYVQRGDQASIIGGAINFVKELEQLLQSLEGHKHIKGSNENNYTSLSSSSSPFADFFTFPQYSSSSPRSCSTQSINNSGTSNNNESSILGENHSAIADIEVTMVESHANLKVLSKKRPKQLLKMVSGFQSLRLTILHLNVTTVDQMVLYSLSVKVEEDCQLTSVDEIATAVYQLLGRIQEEISIQQQEQEQQQQQQQHQIMELKKTQTLNFQM